MGFYEGLRDNTAKNLLIKFGRSMTLKKLNEGVFDTNTSTKTDTETSYTVKGITVDIDRHIAQGVQAEYWNQMPIISASGLGVVPSSRDSMIIDGVTYKVLKVIPIAPGGVTVIYKLIVSLGLLEIVHRESPA